MSNVQRKRQPYSKLKAFFVENGISQKEVASYLKKSQSALNQNLNGTGGDFSLKEARILMNEYGIPMIYFFELDVPILELEESN